MRLHRGASSHPSGTTESFLYFHMQITLSGGVLQNFTAPGQKYTACMDMSTQQMAGPVEGKAGYSLRHHLHPCVCVQNSQWEEHQLGVVL